MNGFFCYGNEEDEYITTNNFANSSSEVNVGVSFFVQEMEQDEHNSTNNLSHFIEEIDVGDRFLFNRKIIIKIL